MNNQFDNFFRDKLKKHDIPVDNDHWNEFQAILEGKEKPKRKFILWWWTSGIAAALILAWFIYDTNYNNTRLISDSSQTTDFFKGSSEKPPKTDGIYNHIEPSKEIVGEIKHSSSISNLKVKPSPSTSIHQEIVSSPPNFQSIKPLVSSLIPIHPSSHTNPTKNHHPIVEKQFSNSYNSMPLVTPLNPLPISWISWRSTLNYIGLPLNNIEKLAPTSKSTWGFSLLGFGGLHFMDNYTPHVFIQYGGGIEHFLKLNKYFSIHQGLNYSRKLADFPNLVKQSSPQFSFGVSYNNYTLSPQYFDFIEVPLFVNFNFLKKTIGEFDGKGKDFGAIQLGTQLDYLWRVKGNLVTYTSDKTSIQSGHIDRKHYNKLGVNLILGYRKSIFNKFYSGLMVTHRLQTLERKAYPIPNQDAKSNPTSFRVYFGYYLK